MAEPQHLDIRLTARLGKVRPGDTRSCVQLPQAAEVFETRGLVKVEGTVDRQRPGSTMVIPATGARSKAGSSSAASCSPMVRSTRRSGRRTPCSMRASIPG